jgi:preprotein translocase subunit SecA
LQQALANDWQLPLPLAQMLEEESDLDEDGLRERVLAAAREAYQGKAEMVGEESWSQFERSIMLQAMDSHWREHLSSLDYLRQGIHLRGYAQRDPKQEYKREAFELFSSLLDRIRNDVVRVLLTVRVQSAEQLEEAESVEPLQNLQFQHTDPAAELAEAAAPNSAPAMPSGAVPRVGRNDPCPCGSGKKYKQCHGKLA